LVAPYTGPFTTTQSTRDIYLDQRKYKQAKPIDRGLIYFIDKATPKGVSGDPNQSTFPSGFFGPGNAAMVPNVGTAAPYDAVKASSYAKLVSAVSDSAQFAVNLAEYRQSMGMMVSRIEQLIMFCRHMRKLDFYSALQDIGITNRKDVIRGMKSYKDPLRTLANNWLEYSFGWKPLIDDIYSAVNHFQTPIKSITPRGTARNDRFVKFLDGTIASGIYTYQESRGVLFAKQGCKVSIDNPNLYLANKLGLVNPATVVWELIPFSFVVDWFVNVGEFLSQGTDFFGLTVTQPWACWGLKAQVQDIKANIFNVPPKTVRNWSAVHFERLDALTGANLHVRPFRLWGWQRCANAVSVLTQLMTKR
jgi:hypothetical protein